MSASKPEKASRRTAAIQVDATGGDPCCSSAAAAAAAAAHAGPAGWRAAAARALGPLLWDVIDPRGAFRKRWDLLMMLALAFLIVEIPFVVCFGLDYAWHTPLGEIELAIDCAFVVDIWLSFRTGILDMRTEEIVTDKAVVARSYLRTWFVPDVVSTFPYEWFLMGNAGVAGLVQLVRALRLVKVLRMLRLVKLVKLSRSSLLLHHMAHTLGPNLLQLLKLCLAAAALVHYVACFFYWAALLGNPHHNWAFAYGTHDKSTAVKYITSLYWAVSTLGTVGYGDVRPVTTGERILVILSVMLGLTVFASFVASVSHLVGAINGRAARERVRMQQLDSFLGKRNVPRPLMARIVDFHRRTAARHLLPDELAILDELSVPLRTELVLFIFRSLLERLPLFHGKGAGFISNVVTHLRLEYFSPGDVVMRQGESGDHMWLVAEGELEARLYHRTTRPQQQQPQLGAAAGAEAALPDGCGGGGWEGGVQVGGERRRGSSGGGSCGGGSGYTVLGALRGGDHFGEWSTLLGQRRTATVVALSQCECYSLSRGTVAAVLGRLPELAADFEGMLQSQSCGSGRVYVPGGVLSQTAPPGGIAARRARSHLRELARAFAPRAGMDSHFGPPAQDLAASADRLRARYSGSGSGSTRARRSPAAPAAPSPSASGAAGAPGEQHGPGPRRPQAAGESGAWSQPQPSLWRQSSQQRRQQQQQQLSEGWPTLSHTAPPLATQPVLDLGEFERPPRAWQACLSPRPALRTACSEAAPAVAAAAGAVGGTQREPRLLGRPSLAHDFRCLSSGAGGGSVVGGGGGAATGGWLSRGRGQGAAREFAAIGRHSTPLMRPQAQAEQRPLQARPQAQARAGSASADGAPARAHTGAGCLAPAAASPPAAPTHWAGGQQPLDRRSLPL